MQRDLTQGAPGKLILRFAVPLIFGYLFQQFYNFVDAAIVSQTLGVQALASVGSTGALNYMVLGFCIGMCSGFGIPVSQAFGAKDIPRMRRFVINGAFLSVFFALIITTVTVVFCRQMLTLLHTPSDIIDGACDYIAVIFAFIPVTIFYNYLSSILRALGDSRTPVIFLVIASLLNIGLDFWFILSFGLGVRGAALATGLSQLISGIGCLMVIIRRMDILTFEKSDWHTDRSCLKILTAQGIPMGLQFSITAIGGVIMTAAVNGLGSTAVAAVAASGKIYLLFNCVYDALGTAVATYSGQNKGAGRIDRIRQGIKSSFIAGIIYCTAAFFVVYFFGRNMAMIFFKPEESEAIERTYQVMLSNAWFFIPNMFIFVLRLMMQGVGYTTLAVFAGLFETGARAIVGLFLVPAVGFSGVCFANPLAWVAADIFLFPASHIVLKRLDQEVLRKKAAASFDSHSL